MNRIAGYMAELYELRQLIKLIGAERREDGYYFPFYQYGAPTIMLPLERWIEARKNASMVLANIIGTDKAKPSEEGLTPPSEGG